MAPGATAEPRRYPGEISAVAARPRFAHGAHRPPLPRGFSRAAARSKTGAPAAQRGAGGHTPWVYARTIIPPPTFARKYHRFTRLGARSLGTMLFADPSMTRGEVEVACLTPVDQLYYLATRDLDDKPETIWGRRSLFRMGGKPLLVCEFFLPDIAEFSE